MIKKNGLLSVVTIMVLAFFLMVSCGKSENTSNMKEAKKYFDRGNSYYKVGKVDKAIKEYESAVMYNKNYKEAHYNLAVLYKEKGRNTDAVNAFEEYLRIANDDGAKGDDVVVNYVKEEIQRLKGKNK